MQDISYDEFRAILLFLPINEQFRLSILSSEIYSMIQYNQDFQREIFRNNYSRVIPYLHENLVNIAQIQKRKSKDAKELMSWAVSCGFERVILSCLQYNTVTEHSIQLLRMATTKNHTHVLKIVKDKIYINDVIPGSLLIEAIENNSEDAFIWLVSNCIIPTLARDVVSLVKEASIKGQYNIVKYCLEQGHVKTYQVGFVAQQIISNGMDGEDETRKAILNLLLQ
jgi:hypothetical protein